MRAFSKLVDAIEHAQTADDLAVFSKEIGLDGQRMFLVASRLKFWDVYKRFPVKKHYEVILENQPVKLFFDLEFQIESNRHKDGSKMTKVLIELVAKTLQSFGISHEDVISLDSSSERKFSKHLIFSKCILKDIWTCGSFVKFMLSVASTEETQLFTVLNKWKKAVCFIDSGVYTRNRNFRLFLSSKLGKRDFLKIEEQDTDDKTVFLSSLVTNIPEDHKVVPYNIGPAANKDTNQTKKSKDVEHPSHSAYPDYDETVLSAILPGAIRNVKYFPNENTSKPVIIYDIIGYNFCEHIGRSHRRNNVYFIANIYEKCVYQKCYKCVGFSGKRIPLLFDDSHNLDLISTCEAYEKSYQK